MLNLKEKQYVEIEGLTLPYTLEELDAIGDEAEAEIEKGNYVVADDAFYENMIARVLKRIEANKK